MSWITELFKPAIEGLDEIITSDEERLKATALINNIEANVNVKVIELDIKKLEAQLKIEEIRAGVNQADASGAWYQKAHRPLGMFLVQLIFVAHCVLKLYRVQALGMEELMIVGGFLGIVSGGRSWEKVQAMRK